MIVVRSPLRISLGGGGTDLPSYSDLRGGFLVALAIRAHVYVTLQRTFDRGVIAKYARREDAARVADIEHPLIRETLLEMGLGAETSLEVTSVADVPAGTGLGSSGSFCTALVQAAMLLGRGEGLAPASLAEAACRIEIGRLGEPVGRQDQYAAAFGGLSALHFGTDGAVRREALTLSGDGLAELCRRTLLFFTGRTRSASDILREQDRASRALDPAMLDNLDRVKALGLATRDALLRSDLDAWGEIMREHWERKKRRSAGMTTPRLDAWHELGLRSGAVGGKVVGAGGGGFLLFLAREPERLRAAMRAEGLPELPVTADLDGTTVLSR